MLLKSFIPKSVLTFNLNNEFLYLLFKNIIIIIITIINIQVIQYIAYYINIHILPL